jgi:hypothetical protein
MKRRPSRLRGVVITAGALFLCAAAAGNAQTGTEFESGKEFVRAIGARSLGIGLATVAVPMGSESVWSNPALIAFSRREVSLDLHTKALATDPEADIAATVVIPIQYVGSLAFFARYVDNGVQDVSASSPNPLGSFSNTVLIVGATAATTFFDRLSIGFSAKQLQLRFPCTGDCSQLSSIELAPANTNALDVGAHYLVLCRPTSSLAVGLAATTFGPRFQQIDREQADSLPSRISGGIAYTQIIPNVPDTRLLVSAQVVSRATGGGKPGGRVGAELSYREHVYLRGGYIATGPGEISSPTAGIGLAQGKWHVDLAQLLARTATQTAPSTFFALRYVF